jgi:hypothetical protein
MTDIVASLRVGELVDVFRLSIADSLNGHLCPAPTVFVPVAIEGNRRFDSNHVVKVLKVAVGKQAQVSQRR